MKRGRGFRGWAGRGLGLAWRVTQTAPLRWSRTADAAGWGWESDEVLLLVSDPRIPLLPPTLQLIASLTSIEHTGVKSQQIPAAMAAVFP